MEAISFGIPILATGSWWSARDRECRTQGGWFDLGRRNQSRLPRSPMKYWRAGPSPDEILTYFQTELRGRNELRPVRHAPPLALALHLGRLRSGRGIPVHDGAGHSKIAVGASVGPRAVAIRGVASTISQSSGLREWLDRRHRFFDFVLECWVPSGTGAYSVNPRARRRFDGDDDAWTRLRCATTTFWGSRMVSG